MRFNYERETLIGLARRDVAESVGVFGNATYLWQLLCAEFDTVLFPECTPGIRGTQRHGKPAVIENAIDDNDVIDLQNLSVMGNVVVWTAAPY